MRRLWDHLSCISILDLFDPKIETTDNTELPKKWWYRWIWDNLLWYYGCNSSERLPDVINWGKLKTFTEPTHAIFYSSSSRSIFYDRIYLMFRVHSSLCVFAKSEKMSIPWIFNISHSSYITTFHMSYNFVILIYFHFTRAGMLKICENERWDLG